MAVAGGTTAALRDCTADGDAPGNRRTIVRINGEVIRTTGGEMCRGVTVTGSPPRGRHPHYRMPTTGRSTVFRSPSASVTRVAWRAITATRSASIQLAPKVPEIAATR